MFRLANILSLSFLFCIAANAQSKTLPDALFSTDGKYALIKSQIASHSCKSDVEVWALFFYDSDKEQALFAVKNDSIYMLSFEDKYESQPYYISEVGCETNAHIINSYKLGEFLNRYKFFIQPKNCTKDLVVIYDTIKSEPQKLVWTGGDSIVKMNRTIGVSFYFNNRLLKRDSVQTNVSDSEIEEDMNHTEDSAHKANYLVRFATDNDWYESDDYTTFYYDSTSNYYWLCYAIYCPYIKTEISIEPTDEPQIIIKKAERIQSKIKLSKLN